MNENPPITPEGPNEPLPIPGVSQEITALKSDVEKATQDPFELLAAKYSDYRAEIFLLKNDPQAICYEYTSRKDRPYAKEFLPLCLQHHTRSLLYIALKQADTALMSEINTLLSTIDTSTFVIKNTEVLGALTSKDLQELASKNQIESKKPAVVEGIDYRVIDHKIANIAVQACQHIACIGAFNIPGIQHTQFEAITSQIQSYVQIEVNKRNITNRADYTPKKSLLSPNGVRGLRSVIEEASSSSPYFMQGLSNICKTSPSLSEIRISILSYGTQQLIPDIDTFMDSLTTEQQAHLREQTLSNYTMLADNHDPLYTPPNTVLKTRLLRRYLKLKTRVTLPTTSIDQAIAKGLRDRNISLVAPYTEIKQIEKALRAESEPTKRKMYTEQIKTLKQDLYSKSTLAQLLSHDLDSAFIRDALADPQARQMIVHTIGSELGYLLEDTSFLSSDNGKKLLQLCFSGLTTDKDSKDLRHIESLVQVRITDKRTSAGYLYPHQELIYTYGLRNTFMLHNALLAHPQEIHIGKATYPLLSSSSLLAGVLQRHQQDPNKNPYRTIDISQITTYIQQLQQDVQYFATLPETTQQKEQTSIMALYPGKDDDPNGAFSNYASYIDTLRAQGYGEVIAISSDKYEKKTDNPAEKYGPDKFIQDVQKKIGTNIVGPLKASQQPKPLHIIVALHGGEDGSAQMGKTPFTRQHFEKLVNFSETIKKQYPQSAKYFSLTIDSCFSGNKFDQNPNFVSNVGLSSSANIGTSKQTHDMIQAYDTKTRPQADFNDDASISLHEARLYTVLQNPDKYMPTSFWDERVSKTTILF